MSFLQTMKQVAATLERTADGAMVVEKEGTIVFWNRAAERLLGHPREEVLGRLCCDVMGGETLSGRPLCSRYCPIAARIVRGSGVRQFDMQTRTKAGRSVWLNVSSLPLPSRKPGLFWVIHLFRDMTRQTKVRQLINELHAVFYRLQAPRAAVHSDAPAMIPAAWPLTEREREILQLLAAGSGTRDIANSLGLSPKTVRNHIQRILVRLDVHNRLQALTTVFPPSDAHPHAK